jgi:lipopolysaccharide/colanic/teichoic acid biosynthesis glycosyltransferase
MTASAAQPPALSGARPRERSFPAEVPAPLSSDAGRRAFDVFFSLVGCQVFAPFYILAAALIKLEDGRLVLFRQERLGRHKRPFRIFKLRTMRDGHVTRVGRWLRATGLDETPQFFNVLLGDMSMVGPRPLTADDVVRLGWAGPEHARRWEVNPGITGLAQVFGGRTSRHSGRLDALYVKRRSASLDTQLIAISVVVNMAGKWRTRRWIRQIRSLLSQKRRPS